MNPNTGKLLLAKHRELLGRAEKFTCNACGLIYEIRTIQGPFLWKPNSGMTKKLAQGRVGTFVLCEDCARLPEKETRQKIEAGLAKNGLFG